MLQPNTNITPKYSQETHYNYVKNSGVWGTLLLPIKLVLRFCAIAKLTAQIPAETLSQSHHL